MPWRLQLARMVGNRRSQVRRPRCAAVQVDVIGAGRGHLRHDRLGHHVAWREIGERVQAGHEARPRLVHEEGALAAHRLGDQLLTAERSRAQPQHGRVELDELQVRDVCARPQGQGDPVARGHPGIGGGQVDLPEPAGREDDGTGNSRADPVPLALAHHVQGEPGGAAVRGRGAGRERARARSPRCQDRRRRPASAP